MAAAEIYDYVSVAVPDYDYTLSISVQQAIMEDGSKNQNVRYADDGSEERITISNNSIFFVNLQWPTSNEVNTGIVLDLWADPVKANGKDRSFKWLHTTDGHTYVVRFESSFNRSIKEAAVYEIVNCRLRILGKI